MSQPIPGEIRQYTKWVKVSVRNSNGINTEMHKQITTMQQYMPTGIPMEFIWRDIPCIQEARPA